MIDIPRAASLQSFLSVILSGSAISSVPYHGKMLALTKTVDASCAKLINRCSQRPMASTSTICLVSQGMQVYTHYGRKLSWN